MTSEAVLMRYLSPMTYNYVFIMYTLGDCVFGCNDLHSELSKN